jgi:hypothetical protein
MSEQIRFDCPTCRQTLIAHAELAGEPVKCQCGQLQNVPASVPAYDPPPTRAARKEAELRDTGIIWSILTLVTVGGSVALAGAKYGLLYPYLANLFGIPILFAVFLLIASGALGQILRKCGSSWSTTHSWYYSSGGSAPATEKEAYEHTSGRSWEAKQRGDVLCLILFLGALAIAVPNIVLVTGDFCSLVDSGVCLVILLCTVLIVGAFTACALVSLNRGPTE